MLGSLWERGKLKLAVDSATSTADEPTPIYVLDELVQELGAGDSRAGVDAVCARLAHRSPVVKQKALKVVAHIGRKGSADLRRLMARHSGAVRDLLHFRCEPDPFKGDTEYAQEALNAIHGEPEAAAPSSSGLRGRIQGFGSEAAGGYSGGSGGGMLGFGSESAGGYGGSGGGSSGRMVGFGSADEAGPWQASLRALCAIEAALESSRQAACGQVAAHFKARPEAVRAAADSPQASVRQRAQKLLGPLPSGVLAHSGILDSSRDNAFNFVHDALAAAKRKQ
ncbi:hypothetical protein COHA_007425 [Chlorella ohadii]|uniref:ENTH domain-containing protein n=1 Tax=Chlorella ohadii TaxID=2649997 RepID=A0AAD5DIY2_9CHLO|nr:hypothetical protein COHA_007425 [Chlorella ohadii]